MGEIFHTISNCTSHIETDRRKPFYHIMISHTCKCHLKCQSESALSAVLFFFFFLDDLSLSFNLKKKTILTYTGITVYI